VFAHQQAFNLLAGTHRCGQGITEKKRGPKAASKIQVA
jgi:hypothetical protein